MKQIPDKSRIYRRWSYDPNKDQAHIDNDGKFDQNGYAYRIDGGWRLTDKDHDSIDDLHIAKRIIDALKGNNSIEPTLNDYNFEKLHYGQPLPMKGNDGQDG
jgi:hypothetical protein